MKEVNLGLLSCYKNQFKSRNLCVWKLEPKSTKLKNFRVGKRKEYEESGGNCQKCDPKSWLFTKIIEPKTLQCRFWVEIDKCVEIVNRENHNKVAVLTPKAASRWRVRARRYCFLFPFRVCVSVFFPVCCFSSLFWSFYFDPFLWIFSAISTFLITTNLQNGSANHIPSSSVVQYPV